MNEQQIIPSVRIVPGISDEEVWLRAWTAVANNSRCYDNNVCTVWADKALAEFKKRFRTEAQGYYVERSERAGS